jgi:hypothetical protein
MQNDSIASQLTDIRQRLGALEGDGLSEGATLSRITKSYPRLGIRVTVKTYVHQYRFASDPDTYPPYDGTGTQPPGQYSVPNYCAEDNYI